MNDVPPSCKECGEALILGKRRYGGRHPCVRNRIFNALCDNPNGLTGNELATIVYASDPQGGPDWAQKAMHVHVLWMNRRWEKEKRNLRVRGRGYGGLGSKYRIWITQ